MTDFLQLTALLIFIILSALLCAYLITELIRRKEEKSFERELSRAINEKITSLENANKMLENAYEELKHYTDVLSIDEATLQNILSLGTYTDEDILKIAEEYSLNVNEFIGRINGLKYEITIARAKMVEIVSLIDSGKIQSKKLSTNIMYFKSILNYSCDNADRLANESYVFAEKSRKVLQIMRNSTTEKKQ